MNSAINRGTPAEYQWIRQWRSAVHLLEVTRYPGAGGPALRMVLRALGEAASKSGSRYIAFGTRHFAVATGLDHTTVAAHLRALSSEVDPFIDRVENDRGLQADLYTLRIPDEIADRAAHVAWRRGKIHALRPAFRQLGRTAAFVYEALEDAAGPMVSFEVVAVTGLGRSTVYEALETLAGWNLAARTAGRWRIVASTSLEHLAEQFGCTELIRHQVQRHREERFRYRCVLRGAGWHPVTGLEQWDRGGWPPEPPQDDDEFLAPVPARSQQGRTMYELLHQILGAELVAPHS